MILGKKLCSWRRNIQHQEWTLDIVCMLHQAFVSPCVSPLAMCNDKQLCVSKAVQAVVFPDNQL